MTALTNTTTRTNQINFVQRYPFVSFFTLAIVITWLFALPSLLFELPFKPFQIAGAYGPLLSAVTVSAVIGKEELRSLFRRMKNFHFGLGWYLLAIFGYVLFYLLIAGLSGAPLMQFLAEKWTLIFSLYLPVLFTAFLINPIGEETGWTGFALPHLQKRFSPWLSSVILGVVWAIWHLPGFFIPSEMGEFNPVNFIFFVLISILVRIVWTYIINKSNGSGIVAILLHASSNAVSLVLIPNLLPAPTPEQMTVSGLVLLSMLLVASTVILIFTRGTLSYSRDETI